MGKRKRRTDHDKTTPPSGHLMPYSSRMNSLPKEKSSHSVDSSTIKRLSSIMDIMDSSLRVSSVQQSPVHHYHHHSRGVLSRHPSHFYGRQYSRRNSCSHAETSSSRGTGAPLHDEKPPFKLISQRKSDPRCHTGPGQIFLETGKKQVQFLGNGRWIIGCGEDVLVCGHVYHADCLEHKTCYEDRQDPACPLCLGMLPLMVA